MPQHYSDQYPPASLEPKGGTTPSFDLEDIQTKLGYASNYWRDQFEYIVTDRDMYSGNQWSDSDVEERDGKDMTTLTLNELGRYVDYQQGRMDADDMNVMVSDVDPHGQSSSGKLRSRFVALGDPKAHYDHADVISGIIKVNFKDSRFKVQRSKVTKHMLAGGMGFFRVFTAHETGDPKNLVLRVKAEPEPLNVLYDPGYEEEDGSDGMWCAVSRWMTEAEAKRRFPGQSIQGGAFSFFNTPYGLDHNMWFDDAKKVRCVEYFQVFEETYKGRVLSDGRVLREADYKKVKDELEAKQIQLVDIRDITEREVWATTFVAGKQMKKPVRLPYKQLPIVPAFGKKKWCGNKEVYHSIIRDAEGLQMAQNWLVSDIINQSQKKANPPFMGDPLSIDGYEELWQNANEENTAFLPFNTYHPDAPGRLERPTRPDPQQVDPATLAALSAVTQRLGAVIGMDESAFGHSSNSTSARSTEVRIQTQQFGVGAYTEGLTNALASVARVMIGAIPEIYDGERVVNIVTPDGGEAWVPVNTAAELDTQTGEWVYPDELAVAADMSVRIQAVPGDESRKQRNAMTFEQLTSGDAAARALYFDKIAENMGPDIASQVKLRALSAIPPEAMNAEERKMWMNQKLAAQDALHKLALLDRAMKMEYEMLAQQAGMEPEEPAPEAVKAQAEAQRATADAETAGAKAQQQQFKTEQTQAMLELTKQRGVLQMMREMLGVEDAQQQRAEKTEDMISDKVNRAVLRRAELRNDDPDA